MEQFHIYHNTKTKPRNTLEVHMIQFTKEFLKDPVDLTIEQVKTALQNEIVRFKEQNKKAGSVSIGDIRKFSSYVQAPHIQQRGFCLSGRGRGTSTLHIRETVDKNESQDFLPAVKPW